MADLSRMGAFLYHEESRVMKQSPGSDLRHTEDLTAGRGRCNDEEMSHLKQRDSRSARQIG
jgi:hypothetical protein